MKRKKIYHKRPRPESKTEERITMDDHNTASDLRHVLADAVAENGRLRAQIIELEIAGDHAVANLQRALAQRDEIDFWRLKFKQALRWGKDRQQEGIAALTACRLLEEAEQFNANCEECEGEDVPEKCGECFPYFDKARVARRQAVAEAQEHPVDAEYPGFGLCECGGFPWPHDRELCKEEGQQP